MRGAHRDDARGDDLAAIGAFAVAALRREQDADLAAFGVRFDGYFLESSLYTDGLVDETVARAGSARQDVRKGRRALAAHDRATATTRTA